MPPLRVNNNFDLKFCKRTIVTIRKPLILLKVCLFLIYGTIFSQTFITFLYKQRGITAGELSAMFIVVPFSILLFTNIAGLLVDKFGTPKLIIALTASAEIILILTMINLPSVRQPSERTQIVNVENITALSEKYKSSCPSSREGFCNNTEIEHYESNVVNVSATSEATIIYTESCSFVFENKTWACDDICKRYLVTESCAKKENNRKYMVMIYGVVFVSFFTTYSVVFRIMDTLSMAMIHQHEGNNGQQRFFAFIGKFSLSPLAGFFVDLTTSEGDPNDYATALYFHIVLTILLATFVSKLNVTCNSNPENILSQIFLLKNIDFIVYIFVLLSLGTSWNFSRFYTAWYIEGFKPPTLLLGLIGCVSSLYGLPFLLLAKPILRKTGCPAILVMGLFAYIVNFMSYSYITNPWLCLVIESTSIITYSLQLIAMLDYSYAIAPEGLKASVIAFSCTVHYSLGKTTMGLTGGQVLSFYGERIAFRFMAGMCLVAGLLSGSYYVMRSLGSTGKDKTLDKVEKEDNKDADTSKEYCRVDTDELYSDSSI